MDDDLKTLLRELVSEVRGVREAIQNMKLEVPGLQDNAASTNSLALRIMEYIEHEYHSVK